jgi:hypothetical protein
MVGLTIAVIIVIAGTSTWMRWSNLNAEQTREAMGTSQGVDAGNPFATAPVIPAELSSSQKAADDRAKAEESSSTRSEGAAAFITLGVIFVVTQIVGIFGGFAWGFGGRESLAAWKTTKGFKTFEDYNNYYAPFRSIAQSQLENLQKAMAEHADIAGKSFSKTFRDYVIEQRQLADLDGAPPVAITVSNIAGLTETASRDTAVLNAASAAHAAAIAPLAEPANNVTDDSLGDLDAIVSEIEATSDVNRKKQLVLQLDAPIRTKVVEELKLRKERAEQNKATLHNELDDLFRA